MVAAIDAPPGSALTKSSSQSLQLLPDVAVMIHNIGIGTDKAQARLPLVSDPMTHAELLRCFLYRCLLWPSASP